MDLRSGHPFWLLKNGLLSDYPSLKHDECCEVAVIGGGITGALVAHGLVQEGVETVLVDTRDIGAGSTAASTALLQYEIDTELHELIGSVGEVHAVRSYRLGLEAIDRVERLCGELGDECGFERKSSLYLASRKSDVSKLRKECETRKAFGFHVEYLDAKKIGSRASFAAPGAILSYGNAQVDPFRLTHRLIQAARQQGLRVYDRCKVSKVEPSGGGVVLHTKPGFLIRGRRVVFATGYESQRYLKQNVGSLKSTFALVSEPLDHFDGWPDRALIWETARPYFYLRTTPDDRAIIGGEDVPYATAHKSEQLIARKTRTLQRRFSAMFPRLDIEVSYTWAGTFGETKDGLAYIGRTREFPHAYFALGYGGNGITFSVIAAKIITDLHLGRPSPDADIFRFDR
ncbi:MAG: FAD-dependent oxidoreductase [Nitrospira sp.]|jgi:glycine/D-amino acid oxidase-like deaminating enzyme|nr:MAG: FAD-binding oxidoreductase [Nitrospira sp.]